MPHVRHSTTIRFGASHNGLVATTAKKTPDALQRPITTLAASEHAADALCTLHGIKGKRGKKSSTPKRA